MSATVELRHLTVVPPAGPEPAVAADASAITGTTVREGVLVDVVVMTADLTLFQSAKEAVGERNPVWRARSADEAADLLITGRCGVLLIDMASVSTQGETLIAQIVAQFPEVVVCVAGTREDEPSLVPLITDGLVYRFMHKPTSARRAGMFLQAAIKRHLEQRDGRTADDPLTLLRSMARHRGGLPRKYFVAFVLVCLGLLWLLFVDGRSHVNDVPADPAIEPLPDPIPVVATHRADPVLSRARAALQAGRLESPQGRNALDLFEAVLLAQPDHVEARAGLDATVGQLLARARSSAAAGRKAEAERLLHRVLSVVPDHADAKALLAEVNPPDLPSRQLEREQVAEVRERAASAAAHSSPSKDARAQGVRTLDPAQPLPEPVSSAYFAQLQKPRAPAPVVKRAAIEPDPLAPRYLNAAPAPRVANWRRHPPTGNAPAVAALPTAGLEPPVAQPVPEPEAIALDPSARADAFERVFAPEPVYPAQALRDRIPGWVELEFTVTPTGSVRDVQVVAAEPAGVFEAAATQALVQWRFKPRLVDGRAVAQRTNVTLRFDVAD